MPNESMSNVPNKFPSPQGGSETIKGLVEAVWDYLVSIPSRRVGDDLAQALKFASAFGFHPLKAGRRPPSLSQ